MTDLEFLEQLKQHLLEFEKLLVRHELAEIDAKVRALQQFLHDNKLNPPVASGQTTRLLAEEIQAIMQRNQVLIREGLHMSQALMHLLVDQRPPTTGNYQKPNLSTNSTSPTPSQRIFDARV